MRGSTKCGRDVLWHLQKRTDHLWPQQTLPGDYIVPPSPLTCFCPVPTSARGCEKLWCLSAAFMETCGFHTWFTDTYVTPLITLIYKDGKWWVLSVYLLIICIWRLRKHLHKTDWSSFLLPPVWLSHDYLGFLLHSSASVLLLLHLKSVTAVQSQQEISQQFQKQKEKMLNYQVSFSQFRLKQHSQKDTTTLVHFILCAERIFVSQSSNVTIVSFHRKKPKQNQTTDKYI